MRIKKENNEEFAKKLEKRTRKFAVDIIHLSSSLPDSIESRVVKNQITKSATSIGANYREANRSRSKADFRNKIKICESEASETVFWLEIIMDLNWGELKQTQLNLAEANEILAIFTSIGKTLKL